MTMASAFEILQKYDRQVPRYTSYPPAPHFTREPEEAGAAEMMARSNRIGHRHVSVYFHVPFCPRRCLFCGCHTEIGRPGAFIRRYMEAMERELDILIPMIDRTRPVTQIHFGGGTPNAAPLPRLEGLIRKLRSALAVDPGAEIAIECDPNLLDADKVVALGEMGFTRLSIGIQDFDAKVLEAVNRRFPKTAPKDIFRAARERGLKGNNLDLIYGLPHQTLESFRVAIAKAIDAGPDRISLFPYAHVPWIKGHQSRLQGLPMAGARERFEIAWESRESLVRAGFVPIGMDHFARPDDELAIAAANRGLHRNFQGYCASARSGQVYALGASAISQLHEGYMQNAKDPDRYLAAVEGGRLSHETAYCMRPQDLAVRNIINGLLCDGEARIEASLDAEALDAEWKRAYLEASRANLAPLLADGLAVLEGDVVRLTGKGQYASRAVAAAFDPMLRPEAEQLRPRYSRAL